MTIYKLVQTTWESGRLSDFNLPRTVGHYATLELADCKMKKEIDSRRNNTPDEGIVTSEDFQIYTINVITGLK